jgi:RNA polymerase sigma-70 factor, ECF subfamily
MGTNDRLQDLLLVRAAQAGSRSAFAHLIHAHDQALLRLALRITGSPTDAQDISQEAFLQAYRKLDHFRHDCSFSTWIYRIVTNICLDHLRRNRTRREDSAVVVVKANREDYDLLAYTSDDRPAHNPDDHFLHRELRAYVLLALGTLTPHERMVFDLKHFDEMTLRTISETLSTSERAVRNTLIRATRKLRVCLARYTAPQNSSIQGCCEERCVS